MRQPNANKNTVLLMGRKTAIKQQNSKTVNKEYSISREMETETDEDTEVQTKTTDRQSGKGKLREEPRLQIKA